MLSLRKLKKIVALNNLKMKKISSVHLPSCLLPLRWKIKSKSTKPVESRKGPWWSTQPSPIAEDFPDETSPRLANRLRRTRRILDFHSLSSNRTADDISPPFSARSSPSSVNGLWSETCIHIPPGESDGSCFICQQPRASLAPVADTKEEGGSFNNFSLSPSPPPPVVARNRPLPCKDGKGKGEAESVEPTILWDEVDSPAISTYHHVVSRRGEDFFFICQQPRACLPPVADPKHEDGSFIPKGKLSIPQDDNISPSPSPPPVLRPRNRPMPCEIGKGEGEEDGDESTILWDELDSPPVSPPPVLRPHNRLSPCKVEKRNDDEESEESDESVIRLWLEDDSLAISPSIGPLRRNEPLLCNLRKRKEDEESDESTILWDEVPLSLRPRHRATTIPILTKGKGKGESNKQEEGTKEETKEEPKEETKEETKEEPKEETKEETKGETKVETKADTKGKSKEDRFGWAVDSLNDTADEEIWLSSGMNYPFEF